MTVNETVNETVKWKPLMKPFSCQTCSKMFAHKSNLDVHMRKHVSETQPGSNQSSPSIWTHHLPNNSETLLNTDKIYYFFIKEEVEQD